MTSTRRRWLAGTLLVGVLAVAAAALADDDVTTIGDAVTSGKAGVALRYRFEQVSQDSFDKDASASTLRIRLNYATGDWHNFKAFGEFDYVAHLLFDNFNAGGGTTPGRSEYPVVADPKGSDLNQLYLDYNGLANSRFRLGRQRILLDNQRFVGGVGWRQNEQTYDSFSYRYDDSKRFEFLYSYMWQVNRIFGDDSPAGRNSLEAHIGNGKFKFGDGWSLVPYIYYIDNEDVAAFSTNTVGLRLNGGFKLGNTPLDLTAEYASQDDAANAPIDYSADYMHLLLGVAFTEKFKVSFGFESLGGDADEPGKQFRTPFATLHAFQGWADQFLTTPNAGIDDVYALLTYQMGKWKLTAVYHDFSAQDGDADWGTEFDFSFGRKLGDRYGILIKGALFDADDPAYTDTSKLWLQLTAQF